MVHQAEFERIFKTFLTAEELTTAEKEELEAEVEHEDDDLQRAGRRWAATLHPPSPFSELSGRCQSLCS